MYKRTIMNNTTSFLVIKLNLFLNIQEFSLYLILLTDSLFQKIWTSCWFYVLNLLHLVIDNNKYLYPHFKLCTFIYHLKAIFIIAIYYLLMFILLCTLKQI